MRGGARPNSGRPPVLDAMQRLAVGWQCEAAFEACATANQQVEIDRIFGRSDYADVIANIRAIPVAKRKAWLQSEAFEAHCADVELERHAMDGTDPDAGIPAARIVSVPRRRPQGVRPAIIAKVASDWTAKLGANVSQSTVRKCWDEVRAIERQLKTDDESTDPV